MHGYGREAAECVFALWPLKSQLVYAKCKFTCTHGKVVYHTRALEYMQSDYTESLKLCSVERTAQRKKNIVDQMHKKVINSFTGARNHCA